MKSFGLIWKSALVFLSLTVFPAVADDAPSSIPTFTKDIAPIFQAKCMECHRSGEIAPMALTSYEESRPWAKSIRTEVKEKRMPPWHADPVAGPYKNQNNLTEDEIAKVVNWVDGGAPMGDPAAMPPPKQYVSGWKSGTPDLVFEMPDAFEIGPEGGDIYQCLVLDPMPEDRWVSGVEVHPGNRLVNHHVALFLDADGKMATALDSKTPEPGYPCLGSPGFQPMDLFGIWAPGMEPEFLPEGTARALPQGSRIVMQLHYHRNGKAETDKSSVGLYFTKTPVHKRINLGIAINFMLNIPPGEDNYTSVASTAVPRDVHIHSVFPHMHYLGKNISMKAYLPDGTEKPLVSVSRYDFNWQRNYEFKEPVAIPAGSRVEVKAIYDNSSANPRNPSTPPRMVRFGMGTYDEMNIGFFNATFDDEDRVAKAEDFPRQPSMIMDRGGPPGSIEQVIGMRRKAADPALAGGGVKTE